MAYDPTKAVQRGAALLDRIRPGWFHKCPIKALDLSDDNSCVLGSVYGSYVAKVENVITSAGHVLTARQGTDRQAVRYGFLRKHEERKHEELRDTMARVDREYVALTNEWRNAIRARRGYRLVTA
jgi:uncharacterized protein (UPF0548 family)